MKDSSNSQVEVSHAVDERVHLLKAVLAYSPDAIISLSLDGRIKTWNRAASAIFGFTEEEATSAAANLLVPEGCPEGPNGVFEMALAGAAVDIETVRQCKDGTIIPVRIRSLQIKDAAGRVIGITTSFQDLRQQRQAQEIAEKQRRVLATLNRTGSLLSAELELDKLVQAATDAGVELLGAEFGAFFYNVIDPQGESYTLYTISGVPVEHFSKFPMPRPTAVFHATFHNEGIVRSDDITLDPRYGRNPPYKGMPDGHLPVRSYLAVPVASRSGKVLGGLFFGHSHSNKFTAHHEQFVVGVAAQAAIAIDNAQLFKIAQISEGRFRAAVRAVRGVMWTNSAEGEMTGEQPGWARLTGQTHEQYVGFGWSKAVHPEDVEATIQAWQQAVRDRKPFQFEHRLRCADGEYRLFSISAVPTIDPNHQITEWVGVHTDITDARKTERALRDALERIDLALNAGAIAGTWVWDVQRNRITGDERFARTFSLDPKLCQEGVSLESITPLIHPDDLAAVESKIEETLENGGQYRAEYRIQQHDRSYRWVEANGHCEHDTSGAPLRFPGVLIDIHERKAIEDRLVISETAAQTSSRLLTTVVETAPALIFVKNLQGQFQLANRQTLAFLGKSWEETEGRTDLELLKDQSQAFDVMQNDREVFAGGHSLTREEIVGRDFAGPRVWLSHKAPLVDHNGSMIGLVGTSVEITTRKRAEAALRDSESELRLLLDSTADGFYAIDCNGLTTRCNAALLRMLGYSQDELIGKNLHDIIHHTSSSGDPYPYAACPICRTAQTGVSAHVEGDLFYRADGSSFPVEYWARPVFRMDQLVGAVVNFTDISERKRAEEARQLLLRELNHRVKNLFAIVGGMITMTAKGASSTDDMAKALRGRIDALAKAHGLIRSAITADTQLHSEATLAQLIDTVLAPHVPGNEEITLVVEGPQIALGPSCATSLALVFHELATNAAKYGSLSKIGGLLSITWENVGDALVINWLESGIVMSGLQPSTEGFGTRLTKMSVESQLNGSMNYNWTVEGVKITVSLPTRRLQN